MLLQLFEFTIAHLRLSSATCLEVLSYCQRNQLTNEVVQDHCRQLRIAKITILVLRHLQISLAALTVSAPARNVGKQVNHHPEAQAQAVVAQINLLAVVHRVLLEVRFLEVLR